MRLIDAPVGLFMSSRELCVKTEYFTNGGVDAYIVSSGERFWGGAKTAKELNNVEVTPIDPEELRPKGRWEWDERFHDYACSECHNWDLKTPNYCSNCGAKMEVDNG